ncbi:MAG TPA: peptidase MA family metallohydrolase [Bdellovibrionota bacterium]|nr:peptidase MA family metallohydrolase [Bdellovibrionota bacterium]
MNRIFPILLIFISSVAVAKENVSLDLFFRLLEQGKSKQAQELVPKNLPANHALRRFLEAQILFYQQKYKEAETHLQGIEATGGLSEQIQSLRALAQTTRERTGAFQTFSTKHFEFRFADGKDRVLPMYAADTLESARMRIGDDLGVLPGEKVTVEFYPSWKDFTAISTLTETEVETSGTIALCKFNRISVATPRALLRGYPWLDTVAHEYTHYLINRASNGLAPVWLHEGIAKFEESRWRTSRESNLSKQTQALLLKRLRKGTLIPLEKMHPSIAKLKTPEDAEVAFAEVFYLVSYLVEKRGGIDRVRQLLNTLGTGVEMPRAFSQIYGQNFSELFNGWLAWLKTQSLAEDPYAQAQKISLRADSDAPEDTAHADLLAVQDDQARGFIRIGDLLQERNRLIAARTEYEKADKILPRHSAYLLNKIALASLALNDSNRALEALNKAVEETPEYPASYTRRAMLHLSRKEMEKAEADFLSANALNPFDPEIHLGLQKIYETRNDSVKVAREKNARKALRVPVK